MMALICNVMKAIFIGDEPDSSSRRTLDEGIKTSVDAMSDDGATFGGSNDPNFFLGIHTVTNEADVGAESGVVYEEDARMARDDQVVNNILGPPTIKRIRSFGFAKNVSTEKDAKA